MKDTSLLRIRAPYLLALLLACPGVFAQQYAFQYFGVEQGLTNLAIKTLFQDRTGFIWVVTEHGVLRYEGVRFREFTPEQGLPPSVTASIGEAPDGSVLVGNQSGLFRMRGEKFEKVPLPFSGDAPSGETPVSGTVKINGYNSIFLDGNRTWIGTDKGMLFATTNDGKIRLHAGPVPPAPVKNSVQSLYVEGSRLWWGCDNALCLAEAVNEGRPEASEVKVFDQSAGLKPFHIGAILSDREHNLWITQNRRLLRRRAGASHFEDADPRLPPTGPGSSPRIDSEGRLLVPTTEGLAIREAGRFHVAGRSTGMLPPVYSVLQDREGSMWLGLAGRGLAKWLGYNEWESFSAQSGLTSETVYEVLPQKKGDVWAGTEAGLFHGQRGQYEWEWRALPALGQTPVHAVQQAADGKIWLGTDGRGVARLDPGTSGVTWFGRAAGLDANSPNAILIDREQNIWAGTESGVFVSEHRSGKFRRVTGLPAERCSVLIQTSSGDIWAGSKSGLWQGAGNKWRKFGKQEGMGDDAVISLAFDAAGPGSYGTIWVGYRLRGGITRLQFEHGIPGTGKPTVTHYAAPGGHESNITYFLGFDSKNRLWAGTNLGVQVLDPATNRLGPVRSQGRPDLGRLRSARFRVRTRWPRLDRDQRRAFPLSAARQRCSARAPPRRVHERHERQDRTGSGKRSEARIFLRPAGGPVHRAPLRARSRPCFPIPPHASGAGVERNAGSRTPVPRFAAGTVPAGSAGARFQERLEPDVRPHSGSSVLAPWWRTWWFMGACVLVSFLAAGLLLRRRNSREVAVRHALENAVAERTRELSHQYRHDVSDGPAQPSAFRGAPQP